VLVLFATEIQAYNFMSGPSAAQWSRKQNLCNVRRSLEELKQMFSAGKLIVRKD
jgi:hypothetical protein